MKADRFDLHHEQVGRNVLRHSERLYINCFHSSDGVLMEYRITGSVDTKETPGGAASLIGFMCSLLTEFNNAQQDAIDQREGKAHDEDDCDCCN